MPSRRALLTAVGGGLAALAGCTGGETTPVGGSSPTGTDVTTPPGTATGSPTTGDDRPTRTLREPSPLDASGAWPQEGFDAGHGGVTPAVGVPGSADVYWRLPRARSGPAVLADGRLFHVGDVGEDPSGSPTVTRTHGGTGTASPDGGRRALFCRRAGDGRRLWTRTLGVRQRWPTVAGERVIVGGDGVLAAIRARDGGEVWRQDLGGRTATASTVVGGRVVVSTEVAGAGDRDPDVRAYDATDGTRRWSRPSSLRQAAVAASRDTVVSLSAAFRVGSVLTARALEDGSERWSIELDDSGIPAGPYVAGGVAYVAPDDDGVHAFDLVDGRRRWHYDAETSNVVGVAASPDSAYLVDRGRLAVLGAADGAERWARSPAGGAGYAGRPAVDDGTIYLERAGFPAAVVALSRADGGERWSYTLPEAVVDGDMVTSGLAARPTVAGGAVFAFAEDGLYAFGPGDGAG